jgi:hypothetical protein
MFQHGVTGVGSGWSRDCYDPRGTREFALVFPEKLSQLSPDAISNNGVADSTRRYKTGALPLIGGRLEHANHQEIPARSGALFPNALEFVRVNESLGARKS